MCEGAPILQPWQMDILSCTLIPRGECPAPESSPYLNLSQSSLITPASPMDLHCLFHTLCPTPAPPTWLDTRILASLQSLHFIWTLANNQFVHMFLSSASHSNLWSLPNKFSSPEVHSQINQPVALLPVSDTSSSHSVPSQSGTPRCNSSWL